MTFSSSMSIVRFQQWFGVLSAAFGMQDCWLYLVFAGYVYILYVYKHIPGIGYSPTRLLTSSLLTSFMFNYGWSVTCSCTSQVLQQLENHRWLAISGYIPPIADCCRWPPPSIFCQPALVAEVSKCSTASAQTASRNCRGWGGPVFEGVMGMGQHQNSW